MPLPIQRSSVVRDSLAILLLIACVAALYMTSPRSGDFWVNDAPRHAMDGLFYRDFAADLPLHNLRQYAIDYYLRTPALTILFYPPMFAVVEGVFYGVFGVSPASAQLTVAFFSLLAAVGAYKLLRLWWEPIYAAGACILFLGAPEVALWARQVMLELPCLAFLFWSIYWLCRYVREGRPRQLYFAVLLFCGGIYTKQTILFMVPVFVMMLLLAKGRGFWRDHHIWVAAGVTAVLLLPLAVLTWTFGSANVDAVAGGSWNHLSLLSFASWAYYPRLLPEQLTWLALCLAGVGVVLLAVRRDQLPDQLRWLVLGWGFTGYVFFSLVALKEPRHIIVVFFPLCLLAVAAMRRLPVKLHFCALLLPVAVFADTIVSYHVPYIRGYESAVDYVVARAPKDSVVMFSGYRDGNFIYDLAMRRDRRDMTVLRADKLLLKVAIKRELGVEERHFTDLQIAEMLNAHGVLYVVTQPNFWDDLAPMQQLQRVLHTAQFRRIDVIQLTSNFPQKDRQLEIYKNLGPLKHDKVALSLDLPIIGISVSGTPGSSQK